MGRTARERLEIERWSERLSAQAEDGRLEPVEGSRVYRGKDRPVMGEDDLMAVFRWRPRGGTAPADEEDLAH